MIVHSHFRQSGFLMKLLLSVLCLLAFTFARADETVPDKILLGAGLWSRPAYDGANTNQTVLIPIIRYYSQPYFARTTFGMLEGGLRKELSKGLTIGVQLAYEGARIREESDFLAQHNIASYPPSLSWGMHAVLEQKLGPVPVIALVRLRQDADTNRGAQADFRLTLGIYSHADLNAGLFGQLTWADSLSAQYHYGISAQQSLASGLPGYQAQGGALYRAAGLLWSYDLNNAWLLLGSLETRQLGDGARNSPLTQTGNNEYFSLGLAFRF